MRGSRTFLSNVEIQLSLVALFFAVPVLANCESVTPDNVATAEGVESLVPVRETQRSARIAYRYRHWGVNPAGVSTKIASLASNLESRPQLVKEDFQGSSLHFSGKIVFIMDQGRLYVEDEVASGEVRLMTGERLPAESLLAMRRRFWLETNRSVHRVEDGGGFGPNDYVLSVEAVKNLEADHLISLAIPTSFALQSRIRPANLFLPENSTFSDSRSDIECPEWIEEIKRDDLIPLDANGNHVQGIEAWEYRISVTPPGEEGPDDFTRIVTVMDSVTKLPLDERISLVRPSAGVEFDMERSIYEWLPTEEPTFEQAWFAFGEVAVQFLDIIDRVEEVDSVPNTIYHFQLDPDRSGSTEIPPLPPVRFVNMNDGFTPRETIDMNDAK